jgi:cytoskeletal protein CcmA (bactofilin family)
MNSPSTISTATIVRGNVSGDGSLEILGRIEGSVSMTGQVIVAPNAVVKGNVSATEIQVAGNVLGNLTATDVVVLNPGARVVGDLLGARVGIAEGALVRGLVRTEGEPPLAQPIPVVATRGASAVGKATTSVKSAFAAPSMARPAPAIIAPRPPVAVPAPKPVPVPVPVPVVAHTYERPIVHDPEPEVEVEDELEVDEPTNPPPAPHDDAEQQQSGHSAPPMVVPAIKGQIRAKKKHKGR